MKALRHGNVVDVEHENLMIDSFPDYPCVKCDVICRSIGKCEYWKSWFTKHWNKIRKELLKHENQLY